MAESLKITDVWRFPIGAEQRATITFYGAPGQLPTDEDVALLLEYLEIWQRALAIRESRAAAPEPAPTVQAEGGASHE